MKEYYSDISYEIIDSMIVISGTAIGSEPENIIMNIMNNLINAYQLSVHRSFGFDIPIDISDNIPNLRGYEFWLSIDAAELGKLPNTYNFEFEGVNVYIKQIPSYRYAKLRIEDPFFDPFERIGGGWRRMVGWLENHDFIDSGIIKCDNAYCLEEIKIVNGMTVIDIYVPVARVKAQ